MTKAKEYIAYQGDKPIGTGTVKELAEGLGYSQGTLYYSATPSAHERSTGDKALLLYEIEDDDEEE